MAGLSGATTSGVLRVRRREEIYRELLTQFFVLLKAAQAGDAEHEAWTRALRNFCSQLSLVLDGEGTLFLSERDGYLYVNAIRARIDADAFATQRFLVRELAQRKLSGVIFERGVSQDEVARFLDAFFHAGASVGRSNASANLRSADLEAYLRGLDIHKVHVLGCSEDVASEQADEAAREFETTTGGRTYFKNILVLRHLLRGLDEDCPISAHDQHYIVQAMVHRLLVHEDGRIALDLVREVDGAILDAAIAVAVPAMALARCYGMSDDLACEFGIATLLAGVLLSVDAEDDVKPLERQQVLHLVANGGASGLLLLSALCGWDEHESGESDPSVAAAVLRVVRRWLDGRAKGESFDETRAELVAHGYDGEVIEALQHLVREACSTD